MEPIKHARGAYGVKLNPAWVWPPSAAAEEEPPIEPPPPEGQLIDSWDISHMDNTTALFLKNSVPEVGQAFTAAVGGILYGAKFYLQQSIAIPDRELSAVLYAADGNYPQSFPLFPIQVLATSQPISAEVLTAAGALHEFFFDDGFEMVAGAFYVIAVRLAGVGTQRINIGTDSTGSHHGNGLAEMGGWSNRPDDLIYYLYATP